MQLIESMEEFFLRAFLVSKELDIVDEQHIRRAKPLSQLRHSVSSDAGDHFVGESLARGVDDTHRRAVGYQRAPDGMHQMGFSHPHAAIDEQWIVTARWICGDRPRSRMCELVASPNHKSVERKTRIQLVGGRFAF